MMIYMILGVVQCCLEVAEREGSGWLMMIDGVDLLTLFDGCLGCSGCSGESGFQGGGQVYVREGRVVWKVG
jgi:hypothetical protein